MTEEEARQIADRLFSGYRVLRFELGEQQVFPTHAFGSHRIYTNSRVCKDPDYTWCRGHGASWGEAIVVCARRLASTYGQVPNPVALEVLEEWDELPDPRDVPLRLEPLGINGAGEPDARAGGNWPFRR